MTKNRRAAIRLARQRRRLASGRRAETLPAALPALPAALPALPERSRPPRPPVVLRVAIRRDMSPEMQAVFDEAARRIQDLARVRFVTMADVPDDVPFQVQLPGDEMHLPRGRRPRAAVAFIRAWMDVLLEDPVVAAWINEGVDPDEPETEAEFTEWQERQEADPEVTL